MLTLAEAIREIGRLTYDDLVDARVAQVLATKEGEISAVLD